MLLMMAFVLLAVTGAHHCLHQCPDKPAGNTEQYDFIVVGAGSAGCVVANRLTENPNIKVLLLEAGENETAESEVPYLAGNLQLSPLDWNFTTTRQEKACLGVKNQTCLWPQGHVLGGSSVLNYMIYVRGNRRDFDDWAALGNEGWDYESVLKYFLKLENFTGNVTEENAAYHHVGGPLTVGYVPYHTELADAFVEAGNENGYKTNDYNAATQTGVERIQVTIRDGQRCSTNKAYLWPIVHKRHNFALKTNAIVLQVLLDSANKAYGVRYSVDGVEHTATVTKEVILSAGALNSPQLLMLSGVGDPADLQPFDIPVKVVSKGVGKNFQDHVACGGIDWLVNSSQSLVTRRIINNNTIQEWLNHGQGPLTIPSAVEATAFVHTRLSDASVDFPDIQLFYFSGSPASDGGTVSRIINGFTDEVWNGFYKPIAWRDSISIIPVLLRPKSRGTIGIRSANPYDPPVINPAFYTDPENEDIKTVVGGVKVALEFGNSQAFKKYGATFHDATFPGCENVPLHSDEYWACLARHYITINFHPASSCTMGDRRRDPLAVVDSRLKVYGVKNLRVIDASIMPLVVSGNTNGPTVMIGEKGADMIKEDWNLI